MAGIDTDGKNVVVVTVTVSIPQQFLRFMRILILSFNGVKNG